jgi:hypothetical protein
MSEYYSHLLIPKRSTFAPLPAQVVAFLTALRELGGAPLEAKPALYVPSAKTHVFRSPQTGEEIVFPRREFVKTKTLKAVVPMLERNEDYSVILSGQGPPQLPPFPLFAASDPRWRSEFTDEYSYEVSCNLRPTTLSFSKGSWLKPCTSEQTDGVVSNPWNNETIPVAKAGCARFWVMFHFGKWLVPRIEKGLDLLAPAILNLAGKEFGLATLDEGRSPALRL